MNFVRINCQQQFLSKLKGVIDPEQKRKIIGTEFYKVFWDEIRERYAGGFFARAPFILIGLRAARAMRPPLKRTIIR